MDFREARLLVLLQFSLYSFTAVYAALGMASEAATGALLVIVMFGYFMRLAFKEQKKKGL